MPISLAAAFANLDRGISSIGDARQEQADREQKKQQFDQEMAYRNAALEASNGNRDQAMQLKQMQMQINQGQLDAKIQHYQDLRDFYGSSGAAKQQNADTNSRNADTRAAIAGSIQQNADTNTGKLGLSQQRFDLSTPDGVINHVTDNVMPQFNQDMTGIKNQLQALSDGGLGNSDQARQLAERLAAKQNAYHDMATNPISWYSSSLSALHPAATKKGLDPNSDTVETEVIDSSNPNKTTIQKTKSLVPKLSPAPDSNGYSPLPSRSDLYSTPQDSTNMDLGPVTAPDYSPVQRKKPGYVEQYLGGFHQGGVGAK